MKNDWQNRTEILIGKENLENLQKTCVTIVGLGGVGSFAVEGLVRAGIGNFQLIDYDRVNLSNINRQILATQKTIGLYKTEVMKQRMLEINPEAKIEIFTDFLHKENRFDIIKKSDYILDAIDSIGPKMGLIKDLCSIEKNFVSVLGAGNRINPEMIQITSIWKTTGCPFAKRLKKLLRRNDISKDFPVVFSSEKPIDNSILTDEISIEKEMNTIETHIPKSIIGSISYIPAIMGMMAAGKIINEIIRL
ncbi:MAG: tRNA threonylcarbamoyladenosine dehydratase [Candidatus Cloacimonetes bacterium]|nr:tRNA threonylcarbamoyladenosine dehydratase [Candidatus Cloacimonadota bacterium]